MIGSIGSNQALLAYTAPTPSDATRTVSAKPPVEKQDSVELSAAAKAASDPDHDGD